MHTDEEFSLPVCGPGDRGFPHTPYPGDDSELADARGCASRDLLVEAVGEYRKALDASLRWDMAAAAHSERGWCYESLGLLGLAVRDYRDAAEIYQVHGVPGFPDEYFACAGARLAESGLFDEAIEVFDRGVATAPPGYSVHCIENRKKTIEIRDTPMRRALVLSEATESLRTRREMFCRLVERHGKGWLPDLPADVMLCGAIAARPGTDRDLGAGGMDRSLQAINSHMQQGQELHTRGQYTEACGAFRRAEEMIRALSSICATPATRFILAGLKGNLGISLVAAGKPAEAVAEYDEALKLVDFALEEERLVAHRVVASLASVIPEGVSRYLSANPGAALGVYRARVLYDRALALEALSKPDAAAEDYGQALATWAAIHRLGVRDAVSELESCLFRRAGTRVLLRCFGEAQSDFARGAELLAEEIKRGQADLLPSFLETIRTLVPLLIKLEQNEDAAATLNEALSLMRRVRTRGDLPSGVKGEMSALAQAITPHFQALVRAGLDWQTFTKVGQELGVLQQVGGNSPGRPQPKDEMWCQVCQRLRPVAPSGSPCPVCGYRLRPFHRGTP